MEEYELLPKSVIDNVISRLQEFENGLVDNDHNIKNYAHLCSYSLSITRLKLEENRVQCNVVPFQIANILEER